MSRTGLSIATLIALGTVAVVSRAQAASPPDLAGAYQCLPAPLPCLWPGKAPAITQSGSNLQIKNDKGEIANAKLTSDITISAGGPLNSYGVIRADHSIDWSNGNTWHKQ